MAINHGVGVAWGLGSYYDKAGGDAWTTGVGALVNTGESFSYESDKAEVRNNVGETVSVRYFNFRQTLSLKLYPSATSGGAYDYDDRPYPGARMVLTAAETGGYLDNDMSGTWMVDSVSSERSPDANKTYDVSLSRFTGIASSNVSNL